MSSDQFLFNSLQLFFDDDINHVKTMMNVLKNQAVSMRILDWFVSNYSKKHNYIFETNEGKHFNVYLEYKASLKSYSKRFFDPFCRGPRITFKDHNGTDFQTTVGQLNFFRWVIKNSIIEECKKNITDVENDMIDAVRKRKNTDKDESRRELNKARIKSCIATRTRVKVFFS